MFFRIVIIANFPHEPSDDMIMNIRRYLQDHAININSGQPNPEPTTARLELCHHDENPGEPCTLVRSWELPDS